MLSQVITKFDKHLQQHIKKQWLILTWAILWPQSTNLLFYQYNSDGNIDGVPESFKYWKLEHHETMKGWYESGLPNIFIVYRMSELPKCPRWDDSMYDGIKFLKLPVVELFRTSGTRLLECHDLGLWTPSF